MEKQDDEKQRKLGNDIFQGLIPATSSRVKSGRKQMEQVMIKLHDLGSPSRE